MAEDKNDSKVKTTSDKGKLPSLPRERIQSIIYVLIIVLFVIFVGYLLLRDQTASAFAELEPRAEEQFSILVPQDWQREEESQLIYYFQGAVAEESQHSVLVSYNPEALPDYQQLSDEEKQQLIDLLSQTLSGDSLVQPDGPIELTTADVSETQHDEADRSLAMELSGQGQDGTEYRGRGVTLITPDGGIYVVLVATTAQTYQTSGPQIDRLLNDFDVY